MSTRKVSELRPHPKNEEIYGDHDSKTLPPDFVDSIRERGVLVSILITHDDRVISGHRRWSGAAAAGLERVPVVVFPSKDEDEILEALIHANKQREKTNEQLAREAAELFKVEEILAAKRIKETQFKPEKTEKSSHSSTAVPISGQPQKQAKNNDSEKNGRTEKIVAEKLGIGKQKAVESKIVIERIESLKKQGEEEAAEKLRTTLNKKSIHAAYKEATKPLPEPEDDQDEDDDEDEQEEPQILDDNDQPVPPQAIPAFQQLSELRVFLKELDRAIKKCEEIGKSPVGFHMYWQSAQSNIRSAKKTLHAGRPAYVCPYCRGDDKKCPSCRGMGFVTATSYDLRPEAQEAKGRK